MRIVLAFRRPNGYVGVSLAAHALLAAVVFVLPWLRPAPPAIPEDATFVELAGPIAAARPAPPKAPPRAEPEPPEPPAPKPPEGAHAVEKIPEPSKKKPPKPAEPKPAPAGGAPSRETPSPSGAAGTGITALEGSGDPGLSWYNAAVTGALQAAWVKPVLEGTGTVYSTIVAFEIGRDGNVFNLDVDQPSGFPSLDRSALRAVMDAVPFPPPPPSVRGTVRQRVRFELRPE